MKKFIFLILVCTSGLLSPAQKKLSPRSMRNLVESDLSFAVDQYKILMKNLPPGEVPKTYNISAASLLTSDASWWCSGFYPGTLWYLYEYSSDTIIRQEATKMLGIIESEKNNATDHDLGFKIFCSFGNAYRLTADPSYKKTILQAAGSLSLRYRPSINSIQSWDSSALYKCPVIIDNMMNLELLEWSSKNGGDKQLDTIAVNHANTTMRNHFRPDYSSFHVVDYNVITGAVMRKITRQGSSDSSAWSRGQAWALYGYTMMYRFTGENRYLQLAENIAEFILNNPHLPSDMIPYWDFNAPGIPNAYRDASAAAIMASALLELGRYTQLHSRGRYVSAAEKMIRTLSSPLYRARLGENGGFLLKHSVGAIPFNSEVDVPLTYADYYFVEALMRYKNWYL